MGSVKKDVGRQHPELRELLAVFEPMAYREGYYNTFSNFLDFCVWQYAPSVEPDKRIEEHRAEYQKMLNQVIRLCRERCRLWNKDSGWYDPFGCLFETVSSSFTRQPNGQFFTPPAICDLMAEMVTPQGAKPQMGCEPTCGSGRNVLAANAKNPSTYWVCNDIDPLCVKMTAVNMALNGVVGEVSCNDGLLPIEKTYRFGYQVRPMIATMVEPVAKIALAMFPHMAKQYCLIPMEFSECLYRQIDWDTEQKQTVAATVQQQAEHRKEIHPQGFQGALFEAEQIDMAERKKRAKTVKSKPDTNNNSLTLF